MCTVGRADHCKVELAQRRLHRQARFLRLERRDEEKGARHTPILSLQVSLIIGAPAERLRETARRAANRSLGTGNLGERVERRREIVRAGAGREKSVSRSESPS